MLRGSATAGLLPAEVNPYVLMLSYYTTARGRTGVHPYVKIRDKAADFFLTLAEKFGMTPSSRKRHGWVVADGKEEPNPFEEFIRAGDRRN